ncbi:MAG: hypothetical protein V4487_06125 [Chlamydiota bacterium]
MLELSPARKNKINLNDYPCEQDINNRILMSDFSTLDVEVLEEILFSPLKLSLKKLARSIDCEESHLAPTLTKLAQAGLLSLQDDAILVDKEKRKYFEFQITRFDASFRPDMEFLQGILRKVPIHLLPLWYAIPRTSNNIFESIVEKYLLTPQIFHRYVMELNFGDPILTAIMEDIFQAPDFKVSSSDLIARYNLKRRDFEEMLLVLEFNFVCTIIYEKADDHWVEFVAPFHEWHEYLRFLKATESVPIASSQPIVQYRESDFAFVEDMGALLTHLQKKPIPFERSPLSLSLAKELGSTCSLPTETSAEVVFAQKYLTHLIEKLCLIKLADQIDGCLVALEDAGEWLDLPPDKQALQLYRHPLNRILNATLPGHIANEKVLREAEKSVKRVLHKGWIFFDEFLKGILVPLNDESVVMLKRTGKQWKYALPAYGDDEKTLLKATVFEWLFETGLVKAGTCLGRDCFAVTSFGRFFFDD